MNKNYLFILIAVTAIVLVAVAYSMTATLTLDQIIKNKDCTALSKWGEENMFDENLNVSSEQMSAAMKLATECVGKALKNMGGNSVQSSDITDLEKELDVILQSGNCWWFGSATKKMLLNDDDVTEEQIERINTFWETCVEKKNTLKGNYSEK